ncbi:MAG: SHOCT domain-containing protein [Dehalococcoidales bacterium]
MFIGGVGMLLMVLFWGALIALAVWTVIRLSHSDATAPLRVRNNPLDLAKERYARGEIGKEEFYRIKKDLT